MKVEDKKSLPWGIDKQKLYSQRLIMPSSKYHEISIMGLLVPQGLKQENDESYGCHNGYSLPRVPFREWHIIGLPLWVLLYLSTNGFLAGLSIKETKIWVDIIRIIVIKIELIWHKIYPKGYKKTSVLTFDNFLHLGFEIEESGIYCCNLKMELGFEMIRTGSSCTDFVA